MAFDEIDGGRAAIAVVQAQYGNLYDAIYTVKSIKQLRTRSEAIKKVLIFIDRLNIN